VALMSARGDARRRSPRTLIYAPSRVQAEEPSAGTSRVTDERSRVGLISAVATRSGIPQTAGVEAAQGIGEGSAMGGTEATTEVAAPIGEGALRAAHVSSNHAAPKAASPARTPSRTSFLVVLVRALTFSASLTGLRSGFTYHLRSKI